MKLEQFREDWNYAPVDLEDIAIAAKDVEDDGDLARAAQAYLDAMSAFEVALNDVDVEIG